MEISLSNGNTTKPEETSKINGHSCYFKYEQDPTSDRVTIRYADPNGGAHEFDNENDFLENYATFFEDRYNNQGASAEKDYHFVTIRSFKKTNDTLELSDQEKENANRSYRVGILDTHYNPPKGWRKSNKSKALSKLHWFQSAVIYPIDKYKCSIDSNMKKENDTSNTFQKIKQHFSELIGSIRQQLQDPLTPKASPQDEKEEPEQEESNTRSIRPGQ